MSDEITCPSPIEFMIRGYTVAEYERIKRAWADLTPEQRGEYIYPMDDLPAPRKPGDPVSI